MIADDRPPLPRASLSAVGRSLATLLLALCATTTMLAVESVPDAPRALWNLGRTQGPALWERLVELAVDAEVVAAAEEIVGDAELPPAMRLGARWVRHRSADDAWPAETVRVLRYLLRSSGVFRPLNRGSAAPSRAFPRGMDRLPPGVPDLARPEAGDALMLLVALHDPSPENEKPVLTHLDPIFEPFGADPEQGWLERDSMFAPKYALIGLHQLINRPRDAVLDRVILAELADVPQRYDEMYRDMCLSYLAHHRVALDEMIPWLLAWANQEEGLVPRSMAYQALGGERALEGLLAESRSEDDGRACTAIFAMGYVQEPPPSIAERLLAASRSEDFGRARAAIAAMRYLREPPPSIRERLEAVAADDRRPRLQERAQEVLRDRDRDRRRDRDPPRPRWFRFLYLNYDKDPAEVLEGFKHPTPNPLQGVFWPDLEKKEGRDSEDSGMKEGSGEGEDDPREDGRAEGRIDFGDLLRSKNDREDHAE